LNYNYFLKNNIPCKLCTYNIVNIGVRFKNKYRDICILKPNKKLMGKIEGGSEAANIMIGQVDFLEEPIMVLVRLKEPQVLSDLTEVAVPTR
jgi:hypothetical protein